MSTDTTAETETDSRAERSAGAANDGGGIDLKRVSLYAVVVAMAAFYLAPLWAGFVTAFKSQEAFFRTTPLVPVLPGSEGFTPGPWIEAWAALLPGILNSLWFTVPAAVLSALLGSFAAYGLTNVDWRGQVAVLLLFVGGVFIPYQSVLVPLTQFWNWFPLEIGGLAELAITHVAYGVPICTVLFRGYYLTLDEEMLEAARLDGASLSRIYLRIVLPLSKPMFAVALIYQFTNIWNDLLFALVLAPPQSPPVTIALNQFKGSMVNQYNLQMAGAFIAALPTLVIYVLFGEQFARGVAGET
jgi:glucose/mannose transport system permease protein